MPENCYCQLTPNPSEYPIANVLKLNRGLINQAYLEELFDAVESISDNSPQTPLVVCSRDKDFCLGLDIENFHEGQIAQGHDYHKFEKLLNLIAKLDCPTIAAVEGRCLGAGLSLALTCDFRLCTPQALFGFDEVKRGIIPGSGARLLPKFVGLSMARRMTLAGLELSGTQAETYGLAEECGSDLPAITNYFLQQLHGGTAYKMTRKLLNESYSSEPENWLGSCLAAQNCCIGVKY